MALRPVGIAGERVERERGGGISDRNCGPGKGFAGCQGFPIQLAAVYPRRPRRRSQGDPSAVPFFNEMMRFVSGVCGPLPAFESVTAPIQESVELHEDDPSTEVSRSLRAGKSHQSRLTFSRTIWQVSRRFHFWGHSGLILFGDSNISLF